MNPLFHVSLSNIEIAHIKYFGNSDAVIWWIIRGDIDDTNFVFV